MHTPSGRDIGIFTTYGIIDPRRGMFVYVGQTSNFAWRKRSYSRGPADGRKRPRVAGENIKTWTYDVAALGVKPVIVPLETVQSWRKSLESESAWVCRLAAEKHPLLNKWRSHKEVIRNAYANALSLPASVALPLARPWRSTARKAEEQPKREPQHSKDGRLLPKNQGAAWTRECDGELVKQFRAGAGATDLAKSFLRSKGSIRARLVRLGCIAERQDLPD